VKRRGVDQLRRCDLHGEDVDLGIPYAAICCWWHGRENSSSTWRAIRALQYQDGLWCRHVVCCRWSAVILQSEPLDLEF
jgi:hypothetical protein